MCTRARDGKYLFVCGPGSRHSYWPGKAECRGSGTGPVEWLLKTVTSDLDNFASRHCARPDGPYTFSVSIGATGLTPTPSKARRSHYPKW